MAARAGTRSHGDRREASEVNDDDLRRLVDAEPDHHERQVSERRQRPVKLQRRIK
jgi:hypothetical protein